MIVLATKNPHKIKEIQAILGKEFNFRLLSDYIDFEIKETGRTLLENSLIKAAFTFKVSNLPSLADDSGLFIEALGGEPGIYSSRYGKNDEERINIVLHKLSGIKDRRAKFRAVYVYYCGPDNYEVFEGECSGRITETARGKNGFGYDPIFIPDGYKKTFAELGPTIKNRISHRARALKDFKIYLNRKKTSGI